MKYSLGIDLGTSYFKFGLYDPQFRLAGLGRVAVEKDTGGKGIYEVPVKRFTEFIKTGIAQACSQAGITAAEITSIGYSSQANSFVMLDSDMNPLSPIILWTDSRTEVLDERVAELWSRDDFLETTAIGIDPPVQICVNKLMWIRKTRPELWAKVRCVMTISDYLTYLFTGNKCGDLGSASLLALTDCENRRYWQTAFDILGLDPGLFVERYPVSYYAGETSDYASRNFGIGKGTRFYLGSLDHHIAALGAGIPANADISISIGTVVACVNITEKYLPRKNVCISPWPDGKFCQLTYDCNGAVSLEWYKKNFANQHSVPQLVDMAEKAGGNGGLKALPMAFEKKTLREAFENTSGEHPHGHFVYALMESCADTLANLIRDLSIEEKPKKIAATGGGAASGLWLDIIAKKTGCRVNPCASPEPATLGAAMLPL